MSEPDFKEITEKEEGNEQMMYEQNDTNEREEDYNSIQKISHEMNVSATKDPIALHIGSEGQTTNTSVHASSKMPVKIENINIKIEPTDMEEMAVGTPFTDNISGESKADSLPVKNEINIKLEENDFEQVTVKTELPELPDREIIVKSNGQRQKEYRQRKKMEKQLQSVKKIPKTNAECQRQFRQNQKNKQQSEPLLLARKKMNAERSKRYRDRLKSKKKSAELNSLLSSTEDSFSAVLTENKEAHQIQPSKNNEARRKKDAERAKRYRDRLKSKKKRAELDSLLSLKEESLSTVLIESKKEIDHPHDTNYEELIVGQCQMQTRQIQQSVNNEARKKKMNAERTKRYRDRLKLQKKLAELDSLLSSKEDSLSTVLIETKKEIDHPHDTNRAELIVGQCQMQTSQIQPSVNNEARKRKMNAKRAKRYRDRLKLKKKLAELDSLLSSKEYSLSTVLIKNKKEIDHPHDKNCEELIVGQCQMQTNQIHPSVKNEARKTMNAEYPKRYSERLKSKKKRAELIESKEEIDHFHDTNCEELIVSHCQTLTNQIQPLMNDEAPRVVSPSFRPFQAPDASLRQKENISGEISEEIHFEIETSTSTYTDYHRHDDAHVEFYHQFRNNTFGHTCAVCDRLWWKNDLRKVSNVDETLLRTIIPNYDPRSSIDVCASCKVSLSKKKIPVLSTYNGFKYPTIPSHLPTLNLFEQRRISPRIPFQQTISLNGIYGEIINVPVEVDTIVKKLPRNIEGDNCFHGLINKNNIEEWLKYLVETPLYIHHGIEIDDGFLSRDVPIEDNVTSQRLPLLWNEVKIVHVASPLSILSDEYAEELSFPTIYGGQFRNYREEITVTPSMQATSELRRADRRGADPQHLLYLAAKVMRLRVGQNVAIFFKHLGHSAAITKEQVQSAEYVEQCLETNLAFLRCIPNSAWYWADCRKDLFAMMRQLGAPTAFMTLSSNATGWADLVKLLCKLKNQTEFPSNMNYVDKAKLVIEDSVTCAIYFNKLVNCLLKILQYKKKSPFGKYRVIHYFKRIEFQRRGNPRAHVFLWLDNAPKNLLSNDEDVIRMIDELVSVSEADASGNIKLQTNKHIFMPSRHTITLSPVTDADSDFSEQKLKEYKERYESIRTNLENFEYTDFDHFYTHNDIASDEHYYDIIRAGIDHPKLFYRRKPSEKWNNSFNPFVLHHLKSYMDFQIIQDEYACAGYAVEYVNKHDRGISDLQRQIIRIMDENPEFGIVDVTKKLSTDVLRSVEMSAQEAAWFLLREPLAKSSTATVYIPTLQPSERRKVRKSLRELNELDDECADIFKENWFDKYEKRPEELSDVTLAQFVAKYYINIKGVYAERDIPKIIRYRIYDKADNFDDYRREMVLLHIPFRSEVDDILADDKYLEIYDSNEDLIVERRKEFELNLDVQKTLEICRQLCRNKDEDNIF